MEPISAGAGPSALDMYRTATMDATNPAPSNRLSALATGQNPKDNLSAHVPPAKPTSSSVTYQANGAGPSSNTAGSKINVVA
jgi:hypothetical protein